ncbi:heme NO-binding domain-containing protein [Natrinema sp. 1APR25-10V2]|uniref:heme NO-binding domain-containing protein n=1 Tax=Natrinema sp. 1APR25-10V2 TaxID=2951081 RepID=UPI00287549BC|nr:heme NO-binding domain-containing protein [Natrinema sp. 1APR25-10V2]MDS0473990.1 heme NO-binding domain-containing protein [Natrinema sp. 1APR25-10V2]
MHGIIFTGLKHFVVETYDKGTWNQIREKAGVGGVHYTPVSAYPDEDLVALVEAAVELSGIEQSELLRTFGRYVVPTLVDMYGVYIEDDWDALELVENVEGTIHQALRNSDTLEYEPPAISAIRLDQGVVVVTYGSRRGLCQVAMGLLEGIGDHYDQRLEVYERRCRHDGASQCELVAVGGTTPRRRAERVIEWEFESTT